MRLFAEDLSWRVPGVVTVHEAGDGVQSLAESWQELTGGRGAEERSDVIPIRYAVEDPRRASESRRPPAEIELLKNHTLARPALVLLPGEWRRAGVVSRGERTLKRHAAGLLRCLYTESPRASREARISRRARRTCTGAVARGFWRAWRRSCPPWSETSIWSKENQERGPPRLLGEGPARGGIVGREIIDTKIKLTIGHVKVESVS